MINSEINNPAIPVLLSDLVESILRYSDNPGGCAEYVTAQIRELVGVRMVGLVECISDETGTSHKLVGICPPRKKSYWEQPEIIKFVSMAFQFETPCLIDPETDHEAGFLSPLGIGKCFIVPLLAGSQKVGMLILIGLMDLKGAKEILNALARIAGVIALILRNSLLYRNMESLVETRTRELSLLNEQLEQRVVERTNDLEIKRLELQENQLALINIVEDLNEKSEELRQANAKLQELDRLKSMFIASMSHELRSPLNSIIGFTSILHDGWIGPMNAEQMENLATILRAGKHLLSLINEVIDVSKIESGTIEISSEDFDVHDVVSEAAELFKKDARDKGLDLKVEPIHLIMHTDRRRLFQCVVNLMSNAVKFTEKGIVRMRAHVISDFGFRISEFIRESEDSATPIRHSASHGNLIEISVEDTGIGIKEEDISRLFKAFVRIHASQVMSVKGTGLGLYLTKKIVTEILGGEIGAESDYGKGSRFVMRIPVKCGVEVGE